MNIVYGSREKRKMYHLDAVERNMAGRDCCSSGFQKDSYAVMQDIVLPPAYKRVIEELSCI